MAREPERDRTLDEEGVPDLEAPLADKVETGDPQEGLLPPNEGPRASVDHGVTANEQRRPEPLDERLAREDADVDDAPAAAPREEVQGEEPQGTSPDEEEDLVADEVPVEGALDPEETAMRPESEPGGPPAR
jgi:hypothetical protein